MEALEFERQTVDLAAAGCVSGFTHVFQNLCRIASGCC